MLKLGEKSPKDRSSDRSSDEETEEDSTTKAMSKALFKKKSLLPEDVKMVVNRIQLTGGESKSKYNNTKSHPVKLYSLDWKKSKKIHIELQVTSASGLDQFDPVKALNNGWKPKRKLTKDDLDEEKRKSKGWSLKVQLDPEEIPEFDPEENSKEKPEGCQLELKGAIAVVLETIKESEFMKYRYSKVDRITIKEWGRQTDSGTVGEFPLHTLWTKYQIYDEKQKILKKVSFQDFPKRQPGVYTVKIKLDHINVNELTIDKEKIAEISVIFYTSVVCFHEPANGRQVLVEDDEELSSIRDIKIVDERRIDELAEKHEKKQTEKGFEKWSKYGDEMVKRVMKRKRDELKKSKAPKDIPHGKGLKRKMDAMIKEEKEKPEPKPDLGEETPEDYSDASGALMANWDNFADEAALRAWLKERVPGAGF